MVETPAEPGKEPSPGEPRGPEEASWPPVVSPPVNSPPLKPPGPPAQFPPEKQSGPFLPPIPPPNWSPPPGNSYPYNLAGQGLNQPNKVPLAANGLPLPVFGNPEGYFSFTNKEGKKVYTPYAPTGLRIGAAAIDTLIILVLFFIFFGVFLLFQNPAQVDALTKSLQNPETGAYQSSQVLWINWFFGGIFLLYDTLLLALFRGQTLGKRILAIKVIQVKGVPPGFQVALLRSSFGFSWWLASIIAPFGGLFALISLGMQLMVLFGFVRAINNKRRQGWHDKLAETLVVSSKELVQGINY